MEPLKTERHDYGSAHAYADAWRKWMADTHAWYAFHHMMAAQMVSGAPSMTNGTGAPQAAPQPAVTVTAAGVRVGTSTYTIPSFARRILAELIDCVFTFAIKIIFVYLLIEFDILDLSRYERLINDHADLQTLIDITHELFPLEVIGKILCSLLEAYLISYGFGGLPPGQTPGKNIMGLTVISCHQVFPVVGNPRQVHVSGLLRVPFRHSLQRSLFKNVLVNSLIPLSSIVYVFNYNRALYDVTANTIVVRRQ
ncbi:hypothetical protein PRIPAC_71376 [Pristionchus pacificus]|uniref:RDD domain-containing protein n=1 Tax=Pristionchus pacificus TaxID=54126 RepID=A0A2A6CZT9_PRIPA|nr:hypothetical protein PRIPAC_71376 [Pristionchus pacificus]|eukprot:PDM83744.1 hypothetical protein PRIPAC_30231 [Pristionchus pacificus]